jgi:tetratricopeptide (TPR) repeat protein
MLVVGAGLLLSLGGRGHADEPMREFLDGLRARQYFDWAMLYLDQLQDNPKLSAELKALIPYERAMTLSESAKHSVSPETQQRQLDQALGFLEQFTKESPNHLLAATANSTRAGLLLSKARVDIMQAKLPTNKDNRQEFQNRAREQVTLARAVFDKAHDQYKAAWEAFPKFIDKTAEPAKFEARHRAETNYMRAQLDVALCEFEEGQTYDPNSSNRNFHLKKAVELFRGIFLKYRATVGGLHAQMWEAKCYEEMNDPQRALGIYSELLTHPPEGLKALQDQVRHFRLICHNHDQRREYSMAISEAEDWIKAAKQIEQRGAAGQGIRWELVVALEKQADSSGISVTEKDKLLRQAITHLTTLSKWPGAYRDLATQRIRDLNLRLKGKDGTGDPKDFYSAFTLGQDLVKRAGEKKSVLDSAIQNKSARDEIEKLRADHRELVKEQIRVLRLALSLADSSASRADLNQCRYLLSYGYYLADKPYEAAICAEAVAFNPTKDKQDEQTALDAAYLGVASYIKGFNQTPNELKALRDVDTRLMVRLAEYITAKWPSHAKANETRMLVGRTFAQTDLPKIASEWFLRVPETAENFPEAQCSAGQAFWQQYLMGSIEEDINLKPTTDELSKWRGDAEKFLTTGIERLQKKIPEQSKTPDDLVASKAALAEILLSGGQYQSAIDLISKQPHGVLVAIHVDDETRRPPHPSIRSSRFASHIYQLLLRGRVGLQQLDAAREVMAQLEQLADHSGGADAVTAVYVQLGKELEKELVRLKGAGDKDRFGEVRKSFEQFLDSMYQRGDQNLSSLTWIAETYYGLAQSSLDNASESKTYFDRAASTYVSILDRAKNDKAFSDKDRLAGVRLRLANCRRRQGDFQEAESLLKALITERPRAADVQFEAAYVYFDQGLTGKTDFLKKAVDGEKRGQKGEVWGFTELSTRLQRLIADGRQETRDRYGDKLYEAWYNASLCRQKLGQAQPTTAKKQAELETARSVIETFVRITVDIPDDWWKKFDRLYRQIQSDLGQSPNPLERPTTVVIAAAPVKPKPEKTDTAVAKAEKKPKTEKAEAPKSSGGGMAVAVFLLIVLGGGGTSVWMMLKNKSRQRPVRMTHEPNDLAFNAAPDEPGGGPVFEMQEAAPRKPVKKTVSKSTKPKGA